MSDRHDGLVCTQMHRQAQLHQWLCVPVLSVEAVHEHLTCAAHSAHCLLQVLCSSSLPEPTTFEFTPPAELMLGEEALALPGPEQPSSSSGLKGWEKGVIGACAAVGGLLLIGLAVWGWTRSKSRATAANLTPMATEDGADSGDVSVLTVPRANAV